LLENSLSLSFKVTLFAVGGEVTTDYTNHHMTTLAISITVLKLQRWTS